MTPPRWRRPAIIVAATLALALALVILGPAQPAPYR